MYQRHGHLKDIFVKVGDKIKKGQKIGTVGNGNGQYVNASHDHADFPYNALNGWTSYVFGMTKDQVEKNYANPKDYRSVCAPWFDHLGWGYLQYATYGSKTCYHPGEDWNGKGSGDSDFGLPIYSAFDGEVVYVYNDTGTNSGWGKLLVIKEIKEAPVVVTDPVPPTVSDPVKPADPIKPTNPVQPPSSTQPPVKNIFEMIIEFIMSLFFGKK